jgi:hypothetical protein
MEPKDQENYENFFQLWNDKYSSQPDWVKEIALDVWNLCVDGNPFSTELNEFSDEEIFNECFSRIMNRLTDKE